MKIMKHIKRKVLILLVAAMVLSQVLPNVVLESRAATTGTVNVSSLIFRKGASTSTAMIGGFSKGTQLPIIGSTKDGSGNLWYQVQSGSTKGYVFAEYVTTSGSASTSSGSGMVNVSGLNVRTGPSTSASRLGVIRQGASVTILGKSGEWYKVQTTINGSSVTGFVFASYITPSSGSSGGGSGSGSSGSETASASGKGTVNVYSLNVRTGASTSASRITSIPQGTSVTITGVNGEWYKINVDGSSVSGYVFAEYITKTSNSGGSSGGSGGSSNSETPADFTGTVNVSSLNVRNAASMSGTRIGGITKGTKVTVTAISGEWYKVKVNGSSLTGYVFAEYITKISDSGSSGGSSGGDNGGNSPVKEVGKVTAEPTLRVRSGPGTNYKILGSLATGTSVNILETANGWHKVSVVLNGVTTTGYVSAEWISTDNSGGSSGGNSGGNSGGTVINKTGVVTAGDGLNIRSGPGKSYNKLGTLSYGASLMVLEESNGWYKVKVTLYGVDQTGYVSAEWVDISGNSGGGSGDEPSDADFEASISGFPESYKASLRALHAKYPSWKFVPVKTGLDWNTVVNAETALGICTIQWGNIPYSYLSTENGAYNWATDVYTVMDGKTWYTAAPDVTKYYLDPRNFLSEQKIFMFESLAYESSQSKDVVSSILSNTFMNGTYTLNGTQKSYADTFMEAGQKASVSPYFLSARSKQEVGVKGSGSTSGKHPGYEGYFNFYNIGANDSAGGGAIDKGLNYAKSGTSYMRPWTSPYLSILGGAQFLGQSYISKGQNTSYTQKFNVVYPNSNGKYFTHQYQTAVFAPNTEATTIYKAYKECNALSGSFTFRIPVYNNMPSSPCQLPASTGNPNSYLKSLSVSGHNLTPTFRYDQTSYSIVTTQSSINISATPVSGHASVISGTGYANLNKGSNTIKVVCKAGNGTTTTYTIDVYRN